MIMSSAATSSVLYPVPTSQAPAKLHLPADPGESHLAILMNDASIDQIFALDVGLKITAWNRACEQTHGISRRKAIGNLFTDVVAGVADYPHIMEALVAALKGMKSFVPTEKGAYKGGYFEHHFIPLTSDEGIVGVMVVIHDVAHRVKAEDKLKHLNGALESKTAEIAAFNWIASHDLKEPLRKIYTFIEMVAINEGTKISDLARSNLRRAQSAAQRMGLLTDDIATFAQVAAPTEEPASADLQLLLQRALVQNRRRIENSGARVASAEMPSIYGYPGMLSLLLNHMLNNALKFHKKDARPEVRIKYALVKGEMISHNLAHPKAMYHCLSFQDNGIGIASKYFDKIFDMFQRLHLPDQFKGTGMGLAICRKVAEIHHGFITVESTEGKGSTFSCYLQELSKAE
jgi:PAS domain S-box-containing protein